MVQSVELSPFAFGGLMRTVKRFVLSCSVAGLLIANVAASAHGAEAHGKHTAASDQMKKLHAIMPMFSLASAELEAALEKGDKAAAKAQVDKILAAIPDLKKSKPHKNSKQLKKFRENAANLESAVIETEKLVQKGNFVGAGAQFKAVEAACAACHAKFRD